ncbi:hypothetical protein [Thiolapillus sp.]
MFLAALLLLGFWYIFLREPVIHTGPGVLAPEDPQQFNIASPTPFEFEEYLITPLADFSLEARVLSRKDYRFDRGADLAPVDLALGWGRMSDESVLESLEISQSNRWFRWSTREFPIPRREIETHSANMHMVPANDEVAEALDDVHKGNIVRLKGQLIKVENRAEGWRWRSSLTREDTGGGACELVWVQSLEVVQ